MPRIPSLCTPLRPCMCPDPLSISQCPPRTQPPSTATCKPLQPPVSRGQVSLWVLLFCGFLSSPILSLLSLSHSLLASQSLPLPKCLCPSCEYLSPPSLLAFWVSAPCLCPPLPGSLSSFICLSPHQPPKTLSLSLSLSPILSISHSLQPHISRGRLVTWPHPAPAPIPSWQDVECGAQDYAGTVRSPGAQGPSRACSGNPSRVRSPDLCPHLRS